MKNLKIGTRLALGFAVVLLLLVVLTVTALTRMQTASDLTYRLVNTSIKNQRLVAEWAKITETNYLLVESAYRVPEAEVEKRLMDRMAVGSARSNELLEQIGGSLRNAEVKAQFAATKEHRQAYAAARDAVFKEKHAGNADQAKVIFEKEMQPKSRAYQDEINKLAAMQITAADAVAVSVLDTYASTRTVMISLGLIAIFVGVLFAWRITRSITGPIGKAVKVAETVSSGDLSSQIVADSRDETGMLMHALKKMNDNLVQIVGQVRSGTDTIATASAEIAAGNQDLSSRTEQQAGSLEETASSMEELTSTVKQNADNARQANKLAVNAADIASRGGAVVAEVVSTMGSINDSSRKIVDIISVIDGIAFQTNILALNAAVEAARAGEQGRGFAVVATEVRNLAQRSAAAAKEIKGLIDDSVQKVEAGTSLVDKAGSTMTEIVTSIGHVTDIMNEISNASDEQSTGIEQVNKAIAGMDQVTQQNAALVEQASAAAEAMQEQAGRLAEVVSVFRLQSGQSPVPATAAAPKSAKIEPRMAPAARLKAQVRPGASLKAPAAPVARRKDAAPKAQPAGGERKIPAPAMSGNDDWEEF
jgi:methyl-accepting chemotaxis protein